MSFLLQYLTKMSKYFFLLSPDLMLEIKVIAVTLKDMALSSVCLFKGLDFAHWHSDSSVHQLNGILVMESKLHSISDVGAELCLPIAQAVSLLQARNSVGFHSIMVEGGHVTKM